VHWASGTYGEERTPVIGRSLDRPFRVHHARLLEICEHGIVETIDNTCILAAPLLTLFIVIAASCEMAAATAFAIYIAVLTVGVTVATNQSHKWAHQAKPARLVRMLQRARIIRSPEHHRSHHTAPFKSSYALLQGWLQDN
jgi:sterol desaturase/sphingolipid hydroxylase (fatty acid hydroxylase superfamily)